MELLRQTGVNSEDICTLDDIFAIDPNHTELFLVDHNVPRGPLAELFCFDSQNARKELVKGIIDHHDDESYFCNTCESMKRYDIQKSGSCASLVTKWMMGEPSAQEFSPVASNGPQFLRDNPAEAKGIAQLLLGAILIDTSNLTHKVTPNDIVASRFLAEIVPDIDFLKFYNHLSTVKHSIEGMELTDLLRRDYKDFNTKKGRLGISTILRDIRFLATKFSNFEKDLYDFVAQQNLELYVIMTVADEGDQFRRGGLVLAKDVQIIEQIKRQGKERFGFRSTLAESDDGLEHAGDSWFQWVFEQDNTAASRKEIAPLILETMNGN